ncbi:MAG TPA: hypothetical protein VNP92_35150, partial [Actinophytocola sp.]|nr:hypothetical protein [Actinophytocola sp.]
MEPDLPFRTLCFGDASSRPVEGLRVARTAPEWQQIWAQLTVGRRSPPEIPEVAWETEMVVAFVVGVRGTGGYAARIERLRAEGETMRVFACEERPGENCVTSQA